jgi:hypothetical protein
MKPDKLYIITAVMILVLCFNLSAACEKAPVVVEESTEETEYMIIEEIEEEFAAEEESETEEDEKIQKNIQNRKSWMK